MEPNENLPDVSKWRPRTDRTNTLSKGLLLTCQAIQSRILSEANIERRFNIDNYDSGPGLEDIVRRQISELLPTRYSVEAGVVNDRDGRTAGDYEFLIRNAMWTAATKLGATSESRRVHFPVESIYSAIEIKQTLGFRQLDEAMEKLVKLSRLNRPQQQYGHITENQHLQFLDVEGQILNPLHTTVMATGLQDGITFRDLALRFGNINGMLGRNEMVNELCVLDIGLAFYSIKKDGRYVDATYMWDRNEPLHLSVSDAEPDKVFFLFYVHLAGHLARSVTWSNDVDFAYGGQDIPPIHHFLGKSPLYNFDANLLDNRSKESRSME